MEETQRILSVSKNAKDQAAEEDAQSAVYKEQAESRSRFIKPDMCGKLAYA